MEGRTDDAAVWIAEGEHQTVPGRRMGAHASKGAALAEAAGMLNLMIDDWNRSGAGAKLPRTSPETVEVDAKAFEDACEAGGRHARVDVYRLAVALPAPPGPDRGLGGLAAEIEAAPRFDSALGARIVGEAGAACGDGLEASLAAWETVLPEYRVAVSFHHPGPQPSGRGRRCLATVWHPLSSGGAPRWFGLHADAAMALASAMVQVAGWRKAAGAGRASP